MDTTTTNRVKLNRLLHRVDCLQFNGLKREYDDLLKCSTKAKEIFRNTHEDFQVDRTGAKALEAKRRGLKHATSVFEWAVQHAREYKFRLGLQLELIDKLLDEFDGEVIDTDSDNFECGKEK
jgi:hypothetical protein